MAAQVLSGTGNVSYTNSTGQNVRIVINYLATPDVQSTTISFQGVSCSLASRQSIGKTLAWSGANPSGGQSAWTGEHGGSSSAVPLEIALSNGETFSITFQSIHGVTQGKYNIIIIPEAG